MPSSIVELYIAIKPKAKYQYGIYAAAMLFFHSTKKLS
jgi:hypothetical protein